VPSHQGLQEALPVEIKVEALACDVMAGGGGGALLGLSRTSNISRQVTSACRSIYINFPLVTYRVSGVCTLAVQR
jgi:hypothetical protein